PKNTVYSIKRFMGRRYDQVRDEVGMVSYEVIEGPAGDVRVRIPQTGRDYTPQEISAMILRKLKRDAEAYLGEPVTQAVITVPAYFNDAQRQATKDAGTIAGLDVIRIVNEPTAASLAYGLEKKELQTVLVFDLGGGTYDVSVLEVGEGVIEVRATNGDTHLGGDDYDQRIVDHVADEFQREQGMDLRQDPQALQRLREAAERAKTELSMVLETEINLPFITADAAGPKHLQTRLTRARFEQLTADLTERLRGPFQNALADARLSPADIREVVMVGGATRMPAVGGLVRSLIGEKEIHRGVNPDEVVAVGAALQAGVLSGAVKSIVLLDVTPLSLGVETLGGIMTTLIPRNTTIPTRKTETFSTAEDGQTAVDIHVLQGERPLAADNMPLGRFRLDGIPPAPRGVPQIDVTFDIDANGILNVSARDKTTGREQKITVTATTNLTEADINRMVEEAREHAATDRRRREVVEARNVADQAIYASERNLRELGVQVTPEERQAIEERVARLRQAMEGNDPAAIRSAVDELHQAMYRVSQRVYAGARERPPGPGEEGVVEAEFRPM
ncbi:MAG: molecular chaperone DnaK, partial [Anaerolineae bacterium]|nr:molecular chaperone DnaK [Anaerolineae bacterium]